MAWKFWALRLLHATAVCHIVQRPAWQLPHIALFVIASLQAVLNGILTWQCLATARAAAGATPAAQTA
jgi:hypothetical protein